MRNYLWRLLEYLEKLESQVYEVVVKGEKKVEFWVGRLSNDMKMQYFLAGELSNAALFFSTCANVSTNDKHDKTKRFGWDKEYQKRLEDAELAKMKKAELEKDVLETIKRSVYRAWPYAGVLLRPGERRIWPTQEVKINAIRLPMVSKLTCFVRISTNFDKIRRALPRTFADPRFL